MTTLTASAQQQTGDVDFDQEFYLDVINGLKAAKKHLSPKYFYDALGSQYFDDICQLPEYYPYKTELKLLPRVARGLNQEFRTPLNIVEFGAGSLLKIKPLLDEMENINSYMPIDISGEWLRECCQTLSEQFPQISMQPIAADFTEEIPLPPASAKAFGFFPGSTIGNLTPAEASTFLSTARSSLGEDAYLLIGVDTKKSTEVLHQAYNDGEGVTARFNLNILERINRELDGDFDLDKFEHYAFYNVPVGRVEMHLVSTESQRCRIGDEEIEFNWGESIHTENSYKYTPEEFQSLSSQAGWRTEKLWLADNDMFSMFLLQA